MSERIEVLGHSIEVAWVGAEHPRGPTLVFLHEGLGCVTLWKEFPASVAERVGMRGLVYSRRGYGSSSPVDLPRPLSYMHDEAKLELPALLTTLGLDDVVLIGHSDGASIALIYAGSPQRARPRGIVLMAPHVFAEDVSIESIAAANDAYLEGGLRARLEKHHGTNTHGAFRGWCDAWLDPEFRRWNLEEFVPNIDCPTLVIQGVDDAYGTLRQVDAIERAMRAPCARVVLERCGHSPQRDRPEATLDAIVQWAEALHIDAPRMPSCGGV